MITFSCRFAEGQEKQPVRRGHGDDVSGLRGWY
jgi:hypothetical protein